MSRSRDDDLADVPAMLDAGLSLTVDEAEMRVGLFLPPIRPVEPWALFQAPLTGPVFDAARQRMLARGLCTDEPWAQEQMPGTLKPAGEWVLFLDHVARVKANFSQLTVTTDEGTTRIRFFPGYGPPFRNSRRKFARAPVLTAEHLHVPNDATEDPLPIWIEADAPAPLVDRIVRSAYTEEAGEMALVCDGHASVVEFGPNGAHAVFDDAKPMPLSLRDCLTVYQRVIASSFKTSSFMELGHG